jgi:predicted transcriptional regulator
LRRGGLPPGAGAGYVYDWLRQRQRKAEEQKRRSKKLKRKIKKLTKGKRKERCKGLNKIEKPVVKVKKHLEEKERARDRPK